MGSHSGVKMCRWTKSMLRGRGGCYKHTFYGIESHRCMESTPSLACANKCVFCWRWYSYTLAYLIFNVCIDIEHTHYNLWCNEDCTCYLYIYIYICNSKQSKSLTKLCTMNWAILKSVEVLPIGMYMYQDVSWVTQTLHNTFFHKLTLSPWCTWTHAYLGTTLTQWVQSGSGKWMIPKRLSLELWKTTTKWSNSSKVSTPFDRRWSTCSVCQSKETKELSAPEEDWKVKALGVC